VERLERDPDALSEALQRFARAEGEQVWTLAATLAQVRDPQVEALALRMASEDWEPSRRAAALGVLDALDSPRAVPVALRVLAEDPQPMVRRAALHALPDADGTSQDQAREVLAALGPLLRGDPDPEARRRALIAYAVWHTTTEELAPVLTALRDDPDPAMRAGAAFALQRAGRRSPQIQAALAAACADASQPRLVRENAWHALSAQGPLAGEAALIHTDYARAREGWLESGRP
jgi:HEAT repeat protein